MRYEVTALLEVYADDDEKVHEERVVVRFGKVWQLQDMMIMAGAQLVERLAIWRKTKPLVAKTFNGKTGRVAK